MYKVAENPLGRLPLEILISILMYTRDVRSLCRLAKTSNQFKYLPNLDEETYSAIKNYWTFFYNLTFSNSKHTPLRQLIDGKYSDKADVISHYKILKCTSRKQRRLFEWIVAGELKSIIKENWIPELHFWLEKNFYGYNAIYVASIFKRQEILDYFHNHLPYIDSLYFASVCNNLTKAKKCDLNGIDRPWPRWGIHETALYAAVNKGHSEIVQFLLNEGADVNKSIDRDATPLFVAIEEGNLAMVQLLIAAGADVNKSYQKGLTPLQHATQKGYFNIVKVLTTAGADVNMSGQISAPLYIATAKGYLQIVEYLLKHPAIEINKPTKQRGATVLIVAAEKGNLEIIKLLVASNADINIAADHHTALSIAAEKGHLEVIKFLVSAGADVEKCGDEGSSLFLAAGYGHIEVVKYLLTYSGIQIHKGTSEGATPLLVAADEGHLEIVKLLIAAGADVNALGPHGMNPLYRAAGNGHTETVKYLLSFPQIESNRATQNGITPLMIAARKGFLDIVKMLLTKNSNVYKTIDVSDAITISKKYKHSKVLSFLTMWQVKIANGASLLDKFIAILECETQTKNILSPLTHFFVPNNRLLTIFIQNLKTISKNKTHISEKDVIKIVNRNKSIIPEDKLEFVFQHLLIEKNQVAVCQPTFEDNEVESLVEFFEKKNEDKETEKVLDNKGYFKDYSQANNQKIEKTKVSSESFSEFLESFGVSTEYLLIEKKDQEKILPQKIEELSNAVKSWGFTTCLIEDSLAIPVHSTNVDSWEKILFSPQAEVIEEQAVSKNDTTNSISKTKQSFHFNKPAIKKFEKERPPSKMMMLA